MKQNYILSLKSLITLNIFLFNLISYSQNIQITFANAQNTNDGSDNYYEADIMIQTVDGLSDFKLGSGQLYLNYNTAAFGANVFANSGIEINADFSNGYFLGEKSGVTDFYNISTINDNTGSRVSWAFSQGVSSGAMSEEVSSTPKKMMRVKFKYIDVNQDPMLTFESDEDLVTNSRDQFYTACGPFDTASTTLDCTSTVDPQNVNSQFLDAILNSSGAVLSNVDFKLLTGISIYPNPTNEVVYIKGDVSKLESIDIYNLNGQRVGELKKDFNKIDLRKLPSGLYLMKLKTDIMVKTLKLIKN
ncbi:Por secretion system C-terminal sorting domain-containing protein [Flaviramulus basaltis]|uniref:Por secretion system C-terminal sorting domain-containing protein n=1 Tax=Flaviramulus basaltis TaxID=369401 RepID=A0A1K2IL48_9FLAO|nr:T9SS type A sorting domain-containing protein [Flaviramulus basaltis]SFZ93030.1 Por secretion system C-terminal sorting domain-containing protein [Flaviramulus basaltis]